MSVPSTNMTIASNAQRHAMNVPKHATSTIS
jgi:hypothetical protein